jgi:hypothetical protein
MKEKGIKAYDIGFFTGKNNQLRIQKKSGQIKPLRYSEIDDITRIFEEN